ncbi:MAG: enoyl-CoA hydratase-related protein [Burkholderiaceae bacterium]
MTTVLEETRDGVAWHIDALPDPGAGPDAMGEVATIRIERPERANALSTALMERFVACVQASGDRPMMRAIVITGHGAIFVGGADIHEMSALEPASARAFITRVHRCCDCLRAAPVPVIARINGLTLGAGLEMAAACDLRVVAREARLGMPEVKLGIPSVVEAALLPGLIGWGRTRELLLLGDLIDADEALAMGLVERVVPAQELDTAVERWLHSLFANGPQAVRDQKALLRRWEKLPLAEAVVAGIDAFAMSWERPEPARMMREWRERRAIAKGRPAPGRSGSGEAG